MPEELSGCTRRHLRGVSKVATEFRRYFACYSARLMLPEWLVPPPLPPSLPSSGVTCSQRDFLATGTAWSDTEEDGVPSGSCDVQRECKATEICVKS